MTESEHPGGNRDFWTDDMVERYDIRQLLMSEKKMERIASIIRIVQYFCDTRHIADPDILDIGCGPGSETTLAKHLLEKIPACTVTGIDSSEQMLNTAFSRLKQYGTRFTGYPCNFNSVDFWRPEIDKKYDFITAFAALHFLSDTRAQSIFDEFFRHLRENGVFIASIATRSTSPQIAETGKTFRILDTYNNIPEERRPADYNAFRENFEETENRANINWKSSRRWLELIGNAGFAEADVVSCYWNTSIFLAIK